MTRRLPEDTEMERSLLSTICAPGAEAAAATIVPTLCEADFMHPAHKAVYLALREVIKSGGEVGRSTILHALEANQDASKVGGYAGLYELLSGEEVGRPEALVQMLQDLRRRRELMVLGEKITRSAETDEPGEILGWAGQEMAQIAQTNGRGQSEEVANFSDNALADVLDAVEGRKATGTRMHGWHRVNGMTQGFQPGNLVILAARPGIGKTAIALNWMLAGARNNARVALWSLEMSREEVWKRLVADRAGVNVREMVKNRDQEAFRRFANGKCEVDELPIHISDRAKITIPEIQAQVDRLITKHGRLDLVVIDYLQLLSSEDSKTQNENARIGQITRALKLMAKDRHVPVLLLSQLNREVEKRESGKPRLSDLRDSGCVEQDADLVIFIHRRMDENKAELLFAKHRNGPVGSIPVEFDPALTRYVEIDDRQTSTPIMPLLQKAIPQRSWETEDFA